MDFELREAKEKWERQQKEKKDRARRAREFEKKAKDEAAKRQQLIDSAHLARRQADAVAIQAAQHRQEASMWLGDGVSYDRVLKAIGVPGNGDKIRLPVSAFRELSNQNAIDKGPMFFEVSVVLEDYVNADEEERKSTHSGVLEFVAKEGQVELPPHVWNNAGLAEASLHGNTKVRVRYVRLPKGTYAKFKAEGLDFVDVPNHKAVLETKLRQHASLSEGDLLTVQHAGVDYGLRVLELKPSSSVSVLETDMEADVVGGVIDDRQQAGVSSQSRLVQLELGKSRKGVVLEGEYAYFKFSLDSQLAKSVASGESDVLVHLDVGDSAADADLYVGAHPLLFPTQHNHEWSSNDKGSKVVVLNTPGRTVGASTYSVGVHGFSGEAEFHILVEVKNSVGQQTNAGQRLGKSLADATTNQAEEGYGQCDNCKQLVPAGKKFLHEAYCFRHNVLCKHPECGVVLRKEEMEKHVHCSKCGQAVKKEELEKHLKVYHEPLKCGCGEVLEMAEMVNHRATLCPLRSITCRFCGDMVQAGVQAANVRDRLRGLTDHESSCGSRTASCDDCGRATMLKEMDLHKAAAHGGSSDSMGFHTPHSSSGGSTPPRSGDMETSHRPRSMQCPMCNRLYEGRDATWELNAHIDAEHGAGAPTGDSTVEEMDVDKASAEGNVPSKFVNRSRTLSVSCPICGLAVHSERDLSFHIDMVH